MDYIKKIFTPAHWADAATYFCVFLMIASLASCIICVFLSMVLSAEDTFTTRGIALWSFIAFFLFGMLSGLLYSIHRIMISAEQIAMSNEAIFNFMRSQAKAQAVPCKQ